MVTFVNEDDFQKEVLESELPVLVDFYAVWCGPCKMMEPVLEKLSNDWADKLRVVKVNVDDNPDLASTYGIMSIPNMILFKSGEKAAEIIGAKPLPALIQTLQAAL